MRSLIFIVALFTLFAGQASVASPLDDARNAGQVVEVATGYVEATANASASVKALVADINQRRKAAYERIAKKNGITEAQVGAESYKKRMAGGH